MKYMAVVECVSSGRLYIDDIISHGYRPLIINLNIHTEEMEEYRKLIAKGIGDKADYIDDDGDFDALLEKLKKYDIAAVFAGAENGVRLTDRLVKALGLRGNDEATTYLRCNKAGMYEALGKAGIRRIESTHVKSKDDITKFWKDYDLKMCVLKFAESAGTVGLKICSSLDDALDYFETMKSIPTFKGEVGADILIQEFIGGTEYIVDSLSCNGKHMITDIWVYNKIRADDGTIAYDSVKLIKDIEPGHTDMIQYVYKVLDAVDMKWGLCHTEVKIDEKGPVLIETNARPIGLAMTASYLDEALGYHLTDMAVDIYLDPKRFNRYARRIYNPPKYAMMKLMIVPEDIKGSFDPTFTFSNMIRSTREILFFGKEGMAEYHRTVDLETSPLAIKMINADYGELMKDYELLRTIESRYFHLFYSIGDEVEATEPKTDINAILRNLDPNRKFLVVTDSERYAYQFGKRSETDAFEIFDGAVFAECGRCKAEDRYRSMFMVMHNIRSGGVFIAVPESYEKMKSGSAVMDFMMDVAGVRIMLPFYESAGAVFGVKK